MSEPPSPIRAAEARLWRAGRAGPPEARLVPETAPMRLAVALGRCFRRRGRGFVPRAALSLLGRSGVVVATRWGGRFFARRGDAAFLLGVGYEPLETAVVWRLLTPGMTVIDVGANRGWYSVLAARCVGTSGRVIALEPGRAALAQLRASLALNPFCAAVEVLELAASDQDGSAELVETADISTSHLALRSAAGQQTVRQARLDAIVAEQGVGRVDFVKIDVEGAEAKVLVGMRGMLAAAEPPLLLVECLDVTLRPFGASVDGLLGLLGELSGDRYEIFFLCHRHGTAEAPGHACRDASSNLLALPRSRAQELLAALFAA